MTVSLAESEGLTRADALLGAAARALAAAGVESARREARLMLAAVLGMAPERLFAHPETPASAAQASVFEALVARRAQGEPLSRILGRREFWSLSFGLGPDTLDPRPDSETLVQAVLDRVTRRSDSIRVLDLGTGTGCLLLAVLSELPDARGLGIDISPGALATAAENARHLGLAERAAFLCADWDSALTPEDESPLWDVILSNPPYIEAKAFDDLDRGVTDYDPRLALDGGDDGFDAYRRILPAIARQLAPHGFAVVELGRGQATGVTELAQAAGLDVLDDEKDLSGTVRALVLSHRRR